MNETIAKAASILRASTHLDDEAVFEQLVSSGIDRYLADRLVTFLPMAYASHLLVNAGARLQNYYERVLPNDDLERVQLSSEPVWCASMEFYHAEISRGMSRDDLLAVAARSAEFHAANQALNNGNTLDKGEFGPCHIKWTVDNPESLPVATE
jgi:hypothetical protein